MQRIQALTSAAVLVLAASPALADKIYLTDGSIISDADVSAETIANVTYTVDDSRSEKTVASELVLRVDYSEAPDAFSTAEVDTENEAFPSAAAGYGDYVANRGERDRDHPWAPAAARYRIVQLYRYANEVDGMAEAVETLKTDVADSRYVPVALVDLADQRLLNGDKAGALAVIDELEAGANGATFPQRWKFEAQVRRPFAEGRLNGEALERALAETAKDAAAFATVKGYANAGRAESLLGRGEIDAAIEAARDVTESAGSTRNVMAKAYLVLGEALFRKAEAMSRSGDPDGAKDIFRDARLAYMRVVVSYPFQYGFVAPAALGAGRCFVQIKDENWGDNAISLFRFVRRKFQGSDWAADALQAERSI